MTAAQVPLLDVRDLHAAYGLSRVLFGVSLQVARGVGKTTTMRAVMGMTPPTAGEVRWQGRNVTGWAPHRAARSGLGFVPEDRRIFADLTVWENLEVAQRAARRSGRRANSSRPSGVMLTTWSTPALSPAGSAAFKTSPHGAA